VVEETMEEASEESTSEEPAEVTESPEPQETTPEEPAAEEEAKEETPEEAPSEEPAETAAAPEPQEEPAPEEEAKEEAPEESTAEPVAKAPTPDVSNRAKAAEKEVLKLSNEVHSLRKSLAGAADIIEELETEPMPPAVLAADIVVPDHLVADIARLARQLDREQLVRANMGTISMLHPGMPGVMISTKAGTTLSRLNERGLVGGRLGQGAPPSAPSDWRVLEVLLAATSLETGGPASCIHMMGAYTTAASCEKDLILCSPIDEVGKKMLGKIVIVDPDSENPDDFLRQTAEALKQGGSKCVVIRGHGAYCVGADLDDAWANAAMLEHSMKIVLLARQANLKV
jgi:ribulose-5-phosphate 4-epimerase/fuculose-1-phosphate aldolase